jgi:hypothetical protein
MKKSLDEFLHESGRYKGRLKQSELQTGKPKGTYRFRDEHPLVEGLGFAGFSSSDGEIWNFSKKLRKPKKNCFEIGASKNTEIKKSLDEFIVQSGRYTGRLKQSELQTGKPKGTYRRWDEHPFVEGLLYYGYSSKNGENWVFPSKKAKVHAYERGYRANSRKEIKKRKQKFLYKIQHIHDWKETEQGRAKIEDDTREVRNRLQRKYNKKPAVKIRQSLYAKRYQQENVEKLRIYRKGKNDRKRNERTKALNQFYRTHDIPEYLWHKDEFAAEKDFQSALEHVIVSRFGLDIERWTSLEEIGKPDIYIPELDLILEVKLLSSMWSLDSIAEQSLRYSEIEDTIIVSLDGEPTAWSKIAVSAWMNPEELFGFLAEILEPDE